MILWIHTAFEIAIKFEKLGKFKVDVQQPLVGCIADMKNGREIVAMGWMSALKVIPWKDVLDAAPGMVKGAKRLFTAAKAEMNSQPVDDGSSTTVSFDAEGLANLDNRVRYLQQKIAELNSEQSSSAKLIESLAEQNARVVNAIEVFRVRIRMLIYACCLLGITLTILIFVMVTR